MTVLGIDFGSTKCSAAVLEGRAVRPVSFAAESYGSAYCLPTAAFLESDAQIFVGTDALARRAVDPTRFFEGDHLKRQLHRSDRIPHPDFHILRSSLVAAILAHIKSAAERETGHSIDSLTLAIPAGYTQGGPGWNALESAAQSAGFSDVQFLREPEAAILAFCEHLAEGGVDQPADGTISLIYDFGGMGFQSSLLKRTGEAWQMVGSTATRESTCGAARIDELLMQDFTQKCPAAAEQLLTSDDSGAEDYSRVLSFLTAAKHSFSTSGGRAVNLPDPFARREAYALNETQLSLMIGPMVEETIQCCAEALRIGQLRWGDLGYLVPVGGSSRIPLVWKKLSDEAARGGGSPEQPRTSGINCFDPLLAVCLGAALSRRPPIPPVSITVDDLPHAVIGATYSASLSAAGGSGSYRWQAKSIPPGLSLDSSGALTGIPAGPAGSFVLEVEVADDRQPKPRKSQALLTLAIGYPPSEPWNGPPIFNGQRVSGDVRMQMLLHQAAVSVHHYLTKVVPEFGRKKRTSWQLLHAMFTTGTAPAQNEFPMVLRLTLRVDWKDHRSVSYACRVLRGEAAGPSESPKFFESLVPVVVPPDWGPDQMPLEIRRDMISRSVKESERAIYQYNRDNRSKDSS